jgi:hypothetical protein
VIARDAALASHDVEWLSGAQQRDCVFQPYTAVSKNRLTKPTGRVSHYLGDLVRRWAH